MAANGADEEPENEASTRAKTSQFMGSSTNKDVGAGIPVAMYIASMGMFRVVRHRGKILSSGGFGVNLPVNQKDREVDKECNEEDSKNEGQHGKYDDIEKVKNSVDKDKLQDSSAKDTLKSAEHLFPEEALFLHERGLLQCVDHHESRPLDTSELFQVLIRHGVALPVYLAYSHLRSQTYIVLRHLNVPSDHTVNMDFARGNDEDDLEAEQDDPQDQPLPKTPHQNDSLKTPHQQHNLNTANHATQEKSKNNINTPLSSSEASVTTTTNNSLTEAPNNSNSVTNTDPSCSNNHVIKKRKRPRKSDRQRRKRHVHLLIHASPPPQLMTMTDDITQPFATTALPEKNKPSENSSCSNNNSNSNINNQTTPTSAAPSPMIAFDVYEPNSAFRKTDPGPPSFHVAVTSFTPAHEQDITTFASLQSLLQDSASCSTPTAMQSQQSTYGMESNAEHDKQETTEQQQQMDAKVAFSHDNDSNADKSHQEHKTSVRIAAVSDSGTVLMFRLTDDTVPPIGGAMVMGATDK